jgi:hypothetical protein
MPINIKEIILEKAPGTYNGIHLVKIIFNFPVTWSVLSLEDLKQILRLWIKGEELKYPQKRGFKGRGLLKEEIDKIFEEPF